MLKADVAACLALTLLCMFKFDAIARACARTAVFGIKLCISFTFALFVLFVYKLQFGDSSAWRIARQYASTYAAERRRRVEL